jgi:hypothetical protein
MMCTNLGCAGEIVLFQSYMCRSHSESLGWMSRGCNGALWEGCPRVGTIGYLTDEVLAHTTHGNSAIYGMCLRSRPLLQDPSEDASSISLARLRSARNIPDKESLGAAWRRLHLLQMRSRLCRRPFARDEPWDACKTSIISTALALLRKSFRLQRTASPRVLRQCQRRQGHKACWNDKPPIIRWGDRRVETQSTLAVPSSQREANVQTTMTQQPIAGLIKIAADLILGPRPQEAEVAFLGIRFRRAGVM